MTDSLLQQSVPLLRAILDALPLMVFVMDRKLRILDANLAARRHLGEESESLNKRLCGDILRCVHAHQSTHGCGTTKFCKDCGVRISVESAINGQKVSQLRHRMRLREGDEERDVCYQITTSRFEFGEYVLAVVVFDDISEFMELRRIVPICANCKKIRDDEQFWDHVEQYMQKYMDIRLSHGICPECKKELYPDSL